MFIKKSFVDEIANSMERQLVDGVINKRAAQEEQLVKAANYLNAAAEIFDESGLGVHAELITAVLESLAAKKSKKKKKDKPKAKSAPKAKKAPSSEKMVTNLKEKGWVFDESDANDANFIDDNCALCGDISYSKDKKREHWHLDKPNDPNHTSRFTGSKEELDKRLHVTEPFSGKWNTHGPYESHDELEKKHYPNWFKGDGSIKIYDDSDAKDTDEPVDESELLSMLDDFKTRSGDEDFEDEDLNDPDTFSEEAYHPDFKLNKVDLEDAAYPDLHEEPMQFNVRRDPIQQKQNEEYRRMLDDEDAELDDLGGALTHQLRQDRRKSMGLPLAPRPSGPRGWDTE